MFENTLTILNFLCDIFVFFNDIFSIKLTSPPLILHHNTKWEEGVIKNFGPWPMPKLIRYTWPAKHKKFIKKIRKICTLLPLKTTIDKCLIRKSSKTIDNYWSQKQLIEDKSSTFDSNGEVENSSFFTNKIIINETTPFRKLQVKWISLTDSSCEAAKGRIVVFLKLCWAKGTKPVRKPKPRLALETDRTTREVLILQSFWVEVRPRDVGV